MSNEHIEFDAVVVGAGLAGSSAAMVMAREGLNVALIERGQKPGGKNYFGGAIYTHAIAEVLPDFQDRKPPFERPVTEAGFWFLSETGMTRMTVQGGELSAEPADAYITLRANFDAWWAEQAQEAGAFRGYRSPTGRDLRPDRHHLRGCEQPANAEARADRSGSGACRDGAGNEAGDLPEA